MGKAKQEISDALKAYFGCFALMAGGFVILLIIGGTIELMSDDPVVADVEPVEEIPAAPEVVKPGAGTVERLEFEVLAALGESNRGVERVSSISVKDGLIEIDFAANRNLTDSMTKTAIRHDLWKVLKAVSNSGIEFQFMGIIGTFPLSGDEEINVVRIVTTGEAVGRIDWSDFTPDDVDGMVEQSWTHSRMK